ncbi:expressed unknown protein [Ectocarpus siliculosus]|uniref:Uncharacterized protein n=1 Tax=Ectocarpus siliculosus TaxID=2880 RepID=D8LQH3_ECTSI|nr:expressed unknown protein [Ectocarpus siliculosus]|eukprot:CBN78737.1 expressed unknown protein [Ectocarpus siliculosus]
MGDTPGGFGEAGGGGGGGGGVQAGFFPKGSMGSTFMRQQDGGSEGRQHASSALGAPLPQQQQLPPRRSLPMTLDGRSKTHLKTFMRTVGSLILLPGAGAIRSAVFGDAGGGDPEQLPDAPTAADPGSAEDVGVKREGRPVAAEEDGGIVDVFAEACRAEAWAAAAVGAQFSGASEEECKDYQSRAMGALSRCLDAPLPEVASVMLLLCLFWMHSMETRKVARYFGFAQQVGLELGSLMPEELRHTIAFVACLVTMTLNLDQVGSFSLQVKDQAVWGVSLRDNSCRPGVDPFVLALTALTVACNEMLHDGAGRGGQGAIGAGGLSPRVAPSKVLTDLLTKAAKALEADARDGNRNPEHVLALLHGLRAFTHAARGEAEDAEASGRLMLAIIDRHAAVLHLPLTFTLAEASRRLLAAAAERSSRPAPEGVHVEALGAAVTKLSFARSTQAVKPGAGGVAAATGGGGGWCAFGDDILAAFAGAGGGGDSGGDVLSEAANDNRDRSRSGSMSPPPRRSVRPLSRAAIASQSWQPTTGGAAMPIPSSSAGGASGRESSASLPRWSGGGAAPAGAPSSSCSSGVHRSVLLGSNAAAAPSDWVDRVRKMPTIASSPRASSPNVVHRMGGNGGGNGGDVRSPSPRQEDNNCTSPRSMGMLHPGPMPSAAPSVGVKYMSEPRDNLALLSTVAAPGGYNNPPRRASYEDRSGAERQQAARQRLAGQPGGGGAADRDGGDDLPPPANPGLATGMSFDPNRDDGTFQFTLGPS